MCLGSSYFIVHVCCITYILGAALMVSGLYQSLDVLTVGLLVGTEVMGWFDVAFVLTGGCIDCWLIREYF
jgi:hypothetical protein